VAGYRELLAVSWDDHAMATFKPNLSEVPVWHGDIEQLSVGECLRITSLKPGDLNVLDGSPPCRGFSRYRNRRGFIRPVAGVDRRRPYRLTAAGRHYLEQELAGLESVVRVGLRRLEQV
jgi:site-specific DNA-cytosine methylase